MKSIKIIIKDENRYFAIGLQRSIEEYALKHAKRVTFLTSDDEEHPDIVLSHRYSASSIGGYYGVMAPRRIL